MTLVQTEPKSMKIRKPSRLPAEYQEVEYIQSSGTQLIVIGNSFSTDYKVEIDVQLTATGGDQILFGCATNSYKFGINAYSSNFKTTTGGNSWDNTKSEDSNRHTFIMDKSTTYVDGTSYSSSYVSYTFNFGLGLFSYNREESSSRFPAQMKLFSCKIYDGSIILYDLVPCYRKADDVIGLYDLVNDTFYTNSGGGTFVKGEDQDTPGLVKVSSVYIGNGDSTATKIRPLTPVTTAGIYWSASLGVISFQTSNGVGISIADKNLGATEVYNSGDNKTAANMGYGYQWGNNTGWLYGTNPQTISTTLVNAQNYGPGNYYSSDTFIKITNDSYGWDSSNNVNLWGGTTDTYAARRGPCAEGWHIPSKADCTTLVNAISSITGSVYVSNIIQYCKLPSILPSINRATGERNDGERSGITYSDTYNSQSCGMLYLPTRGSYVIDENRRKAEGLPCRAFSNTFIQPMSNRTKLD